MARNNRVKQSCEKCQRLSDETHIGYDEEKLVCLKCYIQAKWCTSEILRNSNKINMA